MKTLLTMALALGASGCSYFAPIGEKVSGAVKAYCKEPLNVRSVVQEQVNAAIEPNQVRVWCVGDPAENKVR